MTQFRLSNSTQQAIQAAISDGPGTGNQNRIKAYNAIYSDIQANGGVNKGTANWFSQAANVNTQATGNSVNAAGTFILSYMNIVSWHEAAMR